MNNKKTSLLLAIVSPLALATSSLSFAAPGWEPGNYSDRIIVRYRDTTGPASRSANRENRSERINQATQAQSRPLRRMHDGAEIFQLDAARSVTELQQLAAQLATDAEIESVEIDYRMYQMRTPNDPSYNQQWHLFEAAGGINMPAAWDITTGSSSVVVAVLDTGVRPHADLAANLLPGYNFVSDPWMANNNVGRTNNGNDPGDAVSAGACGNNYPPQSTPNSWHGTHVAGTIGAVGNNGLGVTGVAWNTKIVPVRVLGRCGGYTSDIVDGMRWAAGLPVSGVPNNPNPAKVLNMSLGGTAPCTQTYQRAITDVVNAGVTVVVAAGNENQNAANSSPANCQGVISVAATNRSGGRASYSNFGSSVTIAAPGGEMSWNSTTGGVLSTYNTGTTSVGQDSYDFSQGTSMAAPHVAGVAALMYSVNGNLTPTQVRNAITQSARTFPTVSSNRCTTSLCGAGIVNAEAALRAVGGTPGGNTGSTVTDLQNGVARTIQGARGTELQFKLVVPQGATNLRFAMSGGTGDADIYVRFGQQPTQQNYDHRPYLNGNNETVNISNVQAGTYYVMVHAYQAYSGVTLQASFDVPAPVTNFFENRNRINIPDNNATGVYSNIPVARSGMAGSIAVAVDIRHTYRGDLRVILMTPNGSTATLQSPSNDSAQNLIQTYRFNASSVPAQGTWRLHVVDTARSDVGYINNWSITFE